MVCIMRCIKLKMLTDIIVFKIDRNLDRNYMSTNTTKCSCSALFLARTQIKEKGNIKVVLKVQNFSKTLCVPIKYNCLHFHNHSLPNPHPHTLTLHATFTPVKVAVIKGRCKRTL